MLTEPPPRLQVPDDALLLELETQPFVLRELSEEEEQDLGCALLLHGVAIGALLSWEVGTRGDYICSRLVFPPARRGKHKGRGKPVRCRPDTLTSIDPHDRDFVALARAHACRLGELMEEWLGPAAHVQWLPPRTDSGHKPASQPIDALNYFE